MYTNHDDGQLGVCRSGDEALRSMNLCLPWMALSPEHAATYLVDNRSCLLFPPKIVKAICAKLPVTNNKSKTGVRADDEYLVTSNL